jgi:hypothetical protein
LRQLGRAIALLRFKAQAADRRDRDRQISQGWRCNAIALGEERTTAPLIKNVAENPQFATEITGRSPRQSNVAANFGRCFLLRAMVGT